VQKKQAGKMTNSMAETPSNFIQQIIQEDQKNNKHNGKVHTRFYDSANFCGAL
jgi:hypothetical protein